MHPSECGTCTPSAFARNHYFTGKLLVERDFTDEQAYHAGKLTYHQQRLHGWGVVCGLKVKQHPQQPCRDRIIVIEPGTAIDCCGHTIGVPSEVRFPFADAPEIRALRAKKDTDPHTVQICLRYQECPTEEIPVLYDDCVGDEPRCAPNRILEGYAFGVVIDPPPPGDDPSSVRLTWANTIALAHATRLALHTASRRLYVLNSADPATLYAVSTDNRAVVGSHTLGGKALGLAVSKAGNALAVAFRDTAGVPRVQVLDGGNLTAAPRDLQVPAGATSVDLAVAPDGRLFGLVSVASGTALVAWGADLLATPSVPAVVLTFAVVLSGLVFSTDGTRGHAIDAAGKKVFAIDLAVTPAPVPIEIPLPAGLTPTLLAAAHDTAGDTLLVADAAAKKLHLITPDGTTPPSSVALTNLPVSLTASPRGHWAYVLERDAGTPSGSTVEAINLRRVRRGQPQVPAVPVQVDVNATQLLLTPNGTTLFVASEGDPALPQAGGVAVLDIAEQDCVELLWKSLEGCPTCDAADCVVLATIENYHVGDRLEDPTNPPNPAQDAAAHIARLDNRKGRRLLPSTQALAEVVQCALDNCCGGGDGKQGPPGPKGDPGVKSASAETVPAGTPASATFDPGTGDVHFKIPRGDKGDPGVSAPPLPLTHVCNANWKHGQENGPADLNRAGLLIAFDGPVRNGDIHGQSLMVLTSRQEEAPGRVLFCWCELRTKFVGGVHLIPSGNGCPRLAINEQAPVTGPDDLVNGAQIIPDGGFPPGEYRVVLKGDYVRARSGDGKLRALDGNHLAPWVPTRPTGDGIEGGTFESWFTVR
jgi:hypothetical protein